MKAVELAIRIRDRASVLVASKKRKKEAHAQMLEARTLLTPVEEAFHQIDGQKFHSIYIDTYEKLKKRKKNEKKMTNKKERNKKRASSIHMDERKEQKRMLNAGLAEPHLNSVTVGLPGINTGKF